MERISLRDTVLGVSGAGSRTLLALLPEELRLPGQLRLCVLDASRPDSPELVALLDRLAADPELRPVFVLNKADLPVSVRSVMSRTLAMLKERGFAQAEVYPVCAEAARLFLLPTLGRELSEADQSALARAYDRFGPGENSLSGFAVTGDLRCSVGGRDVSPEQLRLALENTGLPALKARLEELCSEGARLPESAASVGASQAAPTPKPVAVPAERPAVPAAPAGPEPLPAGNAAPEQWFAVIDRTAFEDLEALEDKLRRLPVNEEQSAELLSALSRRRWALQEEQMAELIAPGAEADCAGLLRLAQQVRDSDYPGAIREKALKLLRGQYEARELTELRELTLDADQLELPALKELIARLNAGPYSAQTRAPYLDLLQGRVDELHRQALEEICRDADRAGRPALDQMRELIEERDCAQALKDPFLERIALREEALDLERLEELTADCGVMSVKELDCLAVTLQAENWNRKYIGSFRHKVALCREAALYREVQAKCADLGEMERGEVLALEQELQSLDVPARCTAEPLDRVRERLYRLDMLRLIALENDFDRLSFEGLDELRLKVLQGDYTPAAAEAYLDRLRQRERALIFGYTAGRAALVQQLAAQFRIRQSDLSISTVSADYDEVLEDFWGGSGLEQPRDIPVFLLDNAAVFGFSGSRFWYKTGKGLAFLPLEEIDRFQSFKQGLSLIFQVVRKDNSYLLTEAKLHRIGSAAVLDFLNECLNRWQERAVPADSLPRAAKTPAFLPVQYASAPEIRPLTREQVLRTLQKQYETGKLKDGVLKSGDEAVWQGKIAKLMQGYGLPQNTEVVWFYAPSILGSGREGVAVGPGGFCVKTAKAAADVIPMDQIAALSRVSGRRLLLTTVTGQERELELPAAMEAPLWDYVRGIQLSALLRQQEKARTAEARTPEAAPAAPAPVTGTLEPEPLPAKEPGPAPAGEPEKAPSREPELPEQTEL